MCHFSGTSFNKPSLGDDRCVCGVSVKRQTVAALRVVVAMCLKSSVSGCVFIALGKQHSRKDGVHDNGERGGGRLEDAGPLLQVGRT